MKIINKYRKYTKDTKSELISHVISISVFNIWDHGSEIHKQRFIAVIWRSRTCKLPLIYGYELSGYQFLSFLKQCIVRYSCIIHWSEFSSRLIWSFNSSIDNSQYEYSMVFLYFLFETAFTYFLENSCLSLSEGNNQLINSL